MNGRRNWLAENANRYNRKGVRSYRKLAISFALGLGVGNKCLDFISCIYVSRLLPKKMHANTILLSNSIHFLHGEGCRRSLGKLNVSKSLGLVCLFVLDNFAVFNLTIGLKPSRNIILCVILHNLLKVIIDNIIL